MSYVVRRAVKTHIVVKGRETFEIRVQNSPVVLTGGGGYDPPSPNDGLALIDNTLRVDIEGLPFADIGALQGSDDLIISREGALHKIRGSDILAYILANISGVPLPDVWEMNFSETKHSGLLAVIMEDF